MIDLQDMARKLDKPDSEVLSQFLRGLPPQLKSLVMTQSPTTLADAAQMAMVAESVNKEAEAEEKASLQSTVANLATGLQTITEKLEELQSRPAPSAAAPPAVPFRRPGPDYRRPILGKPVAAVGPQASWGAPSTCNGTGSGYSSGSSSNNSNSRPGPRDAGIQCWNCQQIGHRWRYCPAYVSNVQASPHARANFDPRAQNRRPF